MNKETILLHYLIAVLWTEELDDLCVEDISEDSKVEAMKVVEKFLKEASPLLDDWTEEQIGHDLWLTRGGHGAGFWDRSLPNGDELTKICEKFEFHGEVFKQDGKVYIHG